MSAHFQVQLATDKNFYLRLTVKKMCAFAVFTNKYIRLCSCSDPNFTAAIYYENLKTEKKWNRQNTNHWNTNLVCNKTTNQIFLLCQQETSLFVVNRLIYWNLQIEIEKSKLKSLTLDLFIWYFLLINICCVFCTNSFVFINKGTSPHVPFKHFVYCLGTLVSRNVF